MDQLRYAIRILRKNRSFSLVAILTLALGIGANTAIFSIVHRVLLTPLSFPNPDRVVSLWTTEQKEGNARWRVTPADFLDWRQNSSFESMAAFGASTLSLSGMGEPEQWNGGHVTADYFQVLGMKPILGRSFLREENIPGHRVIILSKMVWDQRFASDRLVIGKTIQLDGNPYEVVGVMPDGIYPTWPETSTRIQFNKSYQQYWVPTSMSPEWKSNRRSHVIGVIGRLKQDRTIAAAQAEMNSLAKQIAPGKGMGVLVTQFEDEVIGNARPALWILLGAVGFVLLIACANVSGLLLARLASRKKELSIRSALGATTMQMFGQFLSEGVVLVLCGGAIGTFLAPVAVNALIRLIPQEIPRLEHVSMNAGVLLFSFGLCMLAAILFGLLMSFYTLRPDLSDSLKTSGRGASETASGRRFQHVLVILQLSLAVMLVLGAGLLVRSFRELGKVDPGFQPDALLVGELSLPAARYPNWYNINSFYNQLVDRVRQQPGVISAAIAYDHPLESNWINDFEIEGSTDESASPGGRFITVSPEYFATAGIDILKGRNFSHDDDPQHEGVVLINETLARRYFRASDPIGRKLRISPPSYMWGNDMPESFEIVGVVRDVKFLGLAEKVEPAFYVPAMQSPISDMKLLVRTKSDPIAFAGMIRTIVASMDPNQAIARITSMNRILDQSFAERRFNMVLMSIFGIVALLLGCIGVYGLFSHIVTLKTREFGVRLALGARPSDILRMVLHKGMSMLLIGGAVGIAGALLLTRFLASQLYGVSATDSFSFALVLSAFGLTGLLACYIPARRATKVDPLVTLREE